MAAGNFKMYFEAKKYMCTGNLDIDGTALRVALHKSSSNASTFTLSTYASISNVCNAAGYTNQKTPGNFVATIVNTSQFKYSHDAIIFTAEGADLTSVMYAIWYLSGGRCLGWVKLSTAVFTVTAGNTLTITPNASGIFTLSGAVS
jgi:hypothetical protein